MKRKGVQKRRSGKKKSYPIEYWSHSSLMAYLRNPLVWYKRYVLKIYDTPRTPASIVGTAAHLALEHFYGGVPKEGSIEAGLRYMREVPDFEINFGAAKTKAAQKAKRQSMEREYLQAIGFYLAKPPRHQVLGIESRGLAKVPGIALKVKAISDLVVESRTTEGAVDIVDHKFVDSFSKGNDKPAFMLQAIFNYYTVKEAYAKEPARFIVIECKKGKNKDGRPQLKRHVLTYSEMDESFELFHRLLRDATKEIETRTSFLPNPSDMFDGEHSFDLYRLRLVDGVP